MTYDVLSDFIGAELSGSAYYYYDEPLRSSTGTQAELLILLAEYTFRNEKDVTDYLELLSGWIPILKESAHLSRKNPRQDFLCLGLLQKISLPSASSF